MVESIYGGEKVFPHYHERSILQRRFSTGTNPLHPISEVNVDTDDERPSRESASNRTLLFVESTVAQHMPHRSSRPRAYSLPAIYRDGSYLRIELPDEARPGVADPNRRFSEPEVVASRGRTALSGNETKSLSSSSSSVDAFESPFEEITQEYEGIRRRSDPLVYTLETQRLAEAEVMGTGGSGSALDLFNTKNSCAPSRRFQNKSVAKCSRRKFSLPPMPLNMVVHRAKHGASAKRRCQSYPPSKPELDRRTQKLLPDIVSSSGRNTSCTSSKTAFYSGDECENGLYAEETGACVHGNSLEILTRWMKFFG